MSTTYYARMLRTLITTLVAAVAFECGIGFERHQSGDELEAFRWRVRVLELEVALLEERMKTVLNEFSELRMRTKALVPNVDEL